MVTEPVASAPPAEPGFDEKPFGPAAAALLAAGIGTLVLGLFTTLAEVSSGIADWLQWDDGVGPLSGKTLLTVVAFFASWGVLGMLWRRANPPLKPVVVTTAVLLAVGFVMTFPKFFQAFA